MAKRTIFKLKVTLKAGSQVFPKDSTFDEKSLPDVLRDDVQAGSPLIEVISFGDDFESAPFEPEQSITFKAPKKKLVGRPKKK